MRVALEKVLLDCVLMGHMGRCLMSCGGAWSPPSRLSSSRIKWSEEVVGATVVMWLLGALVSVLMMLRAGDCPGFGGCLDCAQASSDFDASGGLSLE